MPTFELDPPHDAEPTDLDASGRDSQSGNDGGTPADAGRLTYAQTVMSDAPIAYWRLGDSVPPAHDELDLYPADFIAPAGVSLGLNEPGAIAGDPNTAVHFENGNTVVVKSSNAVTFDFLGRSPFSIEFWLKRHGGGNGILDHFQLDSGDASGYDGWFFAFNGTNSAGESYVRFNRGSSSTVTTLIKPDIFTHLVVTYDGTTVLMFVDAKVIATARDTVVMPPSNAPFRLGTTAGIGSLTGVIDEVALYTKALEPERIKAHHDVAMPQ